MITGRLVATAAKNATALLIGLAISFALLEGSARIMASSLGVSPYMQYHETLGWTATPAATKRHRSKTPPFDVVYEINANGYRGTYYDRAKPVGTRRIVLLGDSVGFGWGIDEGQHFAALLDEALEDTQVINLSLSGYGTDQEYLRLREEGLTFDPDLVILQVTPNDFDEIQYAFYNQKPKPQFVLQPAGALLLTNVPVVGNSRHALEFYANSLPLPFREWLGWHSYSYNWLNEKYYGVRRQYTRSALTPYERFTTNSITLFNRIVALIKVTLAERGVPLIIVHAASEVSTRSLFADHSIPVRDLSSRFADYARTRHESAMFSDGFHWNEQGHRLVANDVIGVVENLWGKTHAAR